MARVKGAMMTRKRRNKVLGLKRKVSDSLTPNATEAISKGEDQAK